MELRKYELAVVLAGNTTAAKKKAFSETLEGYVKTLEGKITAVDDWGKRELAYPLKGNESGYFIIFTLELNGSAAKQLAQKLKLEEELIRHLLVLTDSKERKAENGKKS